MLLAKPAVVGIAEIRVGTAAGRAKLARGMNALHEWIPKIKMVIGHANDFRLAVER
jgi:hypothetical protein